MLDSINSTSFPHFHFHINETNNNSNLMYNLVEANNKYNNNNNLSSYSTWPRSSIHFSFETVLLGIFLICLEILTVVGNVLVLLAIKIDFNLRTPSHYLMGSLALADLLLGLTVLPFSSLQLFFNQWYFSAVFCEVWITFDVLCCTASIYLITQPLRYHMIMTKTRIFIIIFFVWLFSLIVSLVRLIGFKSPDQRTMHNKTCDMDNTFLYALGSASLSYYIPLLIILFVYYKIFKLARLHMRFIKNSKMLQVQSETNIKLIELNEEKKIKKQILHASNSCCCNSTIGTATNNHMSQNKENNKNETSKLEERNQTFTKQLNNSHHHSQKIKANKIRKIDKASSASSYSLASSMDKLSKYEKCAQCKKYKVNATLTKTNSLILAPPPTITKRISFFSRIWNFLKRLAKFKTEQKAAKTLGIVVGCLIGAWAPFFIISPIDAFCKTCQIPKIIFTAFVWLGYCNSAMNPIIYCWSK